MVKKRFRKVKGFIQDIDCEAGDSEGVMDLSEIEEMLNKLYEQREHYRKYALLYITDFDLYSDDFIETIRTIEGDDFANKMLRDREEIITALRREGLYDNR